MNPNENYQEKIERYALGELTPEESKDFEAEISNDVQLREEVEAFKALQDSLIKTEEVDFLNQLDTIGKSIDQQDVSAESDNPFREIKATGNEAKVFPLKRVLAVAAILLLLSLPAYFIFFSLSPSEQLFSEYFEPYDNVVTFRSNARQDKLQEAMQAYDRADFRTSLELLSPIIMEGMAKDTAALYAGCASLALKQTDKAIGYLNSVVNYNHNFVSQAEWFLSLAYLQKNDADKATMLLNKMVSVEDHAYKRKAESLLDAIKK